MRVNVGSVLLASSFLVLAAAPAGCGGPDAKRPDSATSATAASDRGVLPGDTAPSFTIESVNGAGKLTVVAGKVTVVDFWATWCGPCKKSLPKLQELYVKHKGSGLEVLAISVDDDAKGVSDFARTHGAKFPVGWDEGKKIADRWKPESMPSTYVIGRDGVVKHVHRGYHDGEESEIEREIKALF